MVGKVDSHPHIIHYHTTPPRLRFGEARFTLETYRLLTFLDRDGDGALGPGKPRGEAEARPPAAGTWLRLR
ncbi:hypothetical protein CSW23_12320 [Thermus scotoductus]|uniref:Uncharacterized protein n=1 Tax=Thermus scotoductus TaxID=37636 RepID=A0A430UX73_THESC|nr:hypothetical protein CSW31_11975 [Thermus scotoductus]RTI13957.1 hypothetical protein CSW23_12320 [Thermus scotoductus]